MIEVEEAEEEEGGEAKKGVTEVEVDGEEEEEEAGAHGITEEEVTYLKYILQ